MNLTTDFKVFIEEKLIFSDHLNEETLSVVLLHQRPDLMQQCCELVNDEWPRSETARMMSLKTSCDKMPTCLILITGKKEVIGHCKLTPIPSIKESCFIESVVISRSLRGKGLGSFLMKACEEYCRSVLKLKMIHLSTKGQENFYEKIGYKVCEPVTIYGSFQVESKAPFLKTHANNQPTAPLNHTKNPPEKNQNLMKTFVPPPPPTLPGLNTKNDDLLNKTSKTYMVKSIL